MSVKVQSVAEDGEEEEIRGRKYCIYCSHHVYFV